MGKESFTKTLTDLTARFSSTQIVENVAFHGRLKPETLKRQYTFRMRTIGTCMQIQILN